MKKSEFQPTCVHFYPQFGWELSIHGCIQLGLKIDLPGNVVGSQIPEPDSDLFDVIGGIPKVRFN
jgi:hypothetical protein